jgi:precorrin-6B methylase 2
MRVIVREIRGRLQGKIKCEFSHGEMISKLISMHSAGFSQQPVFVETGCGLSTLSLAAEGRRLGATVYSCDYNHEKADELREQATDKVDNVQFLFGDSHDSLKTIAAQHQRIDFLFLDSAASAMHTFREFMIMENNLGTGSCLVVDNAALPSELQTLGPVRKGKILIPYLLASPFWEVTGHPTAGDSMVSAVMREESNYADPEFEHPEYIDNWRDLFNRKL